VTIGLRPFDRQHPQLRRDAAVGGEATQLTAGREHAMARHDDRKRVSSERLPDGARRAGRAEPRGDLAVRERRARQNRARDLVDAAVKRRHAIHVERDGGEIARLAAQQSNDAIDGALHVGWRRRLARVRKSREHACPRPGLARLRQLHAGDGEGGECSNLTCIRDDINAIIAAWRSSSSERSKTKWSRASGNAQPAGACRRRKSIGGSSAKP
jgi:hypothetical protein